MKTMRQRYIDELRASIAKFTALGNRNRAIENHLAKVESMTDEEFAVHKARLDAKAPTDNQVSAIVREALQSGRRS